MLISSKIEEREFEPKVFSPGDLVLFSRDCSQFSFYGSLVCRGAKLLSFSDIDHVGVVVQDPKTSEKLLMEMNFGGMKMTNLSKRILLSKSLSIFHRPLSIYPHQDLKKIPSQINKNRCRDGLPQVVLVGNHNISQEKALLNDQLISFANKRKHLTYYNPLQLGIVGLRNIQNALGLSNILGLGGFNKKVIGSMLEEENCDEMDNNICYDQCRTITSISPLSFFSVAPNSNLRNDASSVKIPYSSSSFCSQFVFSAFVHAFSNSFETNLQQQSVPCLFSIQSNVFPSDILKGVYNSILPSHFYFGHKLEFFYFRSMKNYSQLKNTKKKKKVDDDQESFNDTNFGETNIDIYSPMVAVFDDGYKIKIPSDHKDLKEEAIHQKKKIKKNIKKRKGRKEMIDDFFKYNHFTKMN